MAGYVKLFRSIEQWEWYTDVNTTKVFLHCLIKVNRKDNRHKGVLIKAGTFVTSYELFSKESGLSIQQVRTSLKKLKSTHEITYESTRLGTLIKVNKWADYQSTEDDANTQINTQVNNESTDEQHTINTPSTTNKKKKNIENIKNKEKSTRSPIPFGKYGNVKLTQEEYDNLGLERDVYVQFLDDYMEEKPYKSKNHNLAIQRWVIKAVEERNGKGKKERIYELPKEVPDDRELSDSDKQRIIEKMQSLGKEV